MAPTMNRLPAALVSGAALIAALTLAGCLEHKETVSVRADGSVHVVHRIEGDAGDLDGGEAALPGAGYTVERSTRIKKDGKLVHVLSAEAELAAGAQLPASFAGPEAAGWALRFPTEVGLRSAGAGRTVYRFARTYRGRAWAKYQFHWDRAFTKEVQALFKKAGKLKEMKPAERNVLLGAVARYEQAKLELWAREALEELAVGRPERVEALLAVRSEIGAWTGEHLSPEQLAELLSLPPEQIEARAKALQEEVDGRISRRATAALGLAAADQVRLAEGIARRRAAFEVSQDLGDESFEVRVQLPGRLLEHNGDAVEDGAVVWRFNGQHLRDRDVTLLATSVVEPAKEPEPGKEREAR